MTSQAALDRLAVDTIRFLAADAVEHANSGHPGAPMGAAPMAYVLWDRFLKHNPCNPFWRDRDRFVLSAGHASMLLYSLLHLTGYDLSLEDIKSFRQWGSKTPGHPERGETTGVEVTTGPLGQGFGNAVGMALAEAYLAARFNRPGRTIVDHFTYVLAGDGDFMEGVTSEAGSIAGHLGLGKLIVLYDNNKISLAGSTGLSFTEDVLKRFEAYGWHVQEVEDGNDLAAIEAAIDSAKNMTDRPSFISVRTIIAFGAPHLQGTYKAHGAPLGSEELAAAKANLGWPEARPFLVPDDVRSHLGRAVPRGQARETEWKEALERFSDQDPRLFLEFQRVFERELPAGWDGALPHFPADAKGLATRKASEAALQALIGTVPELMGGSADLNPSTFTWLKKQGDFEPKVHKADDGRDAAEAPEGVQGAVGGAWSYGGRNVHFGVREHAMGAIANGMAAHGGFIPYTATFLTFSDYMRPPMRLAALMGLPVIFIFTHDSIGLGEDGPTHQPIEQIMSLRAIPNMTVIRPADANETVEAWRAALANKEGPTVLVFSRQNLPVLDRAICAPALGLARGGYVLWQTREGEPDVILIGTGSETHIALEAARILAQDAISARVISMPSWELFDRQPEAYRDEVLPRRIKARVSVEAGTRTGWEHYVGLDGAVVGMDHFGASAPAGVLYENFRITAAHVATAARTAMKKHR
jgi:transketolase